ncbi:MAG: hypothetical protein ACRCUI_06635 [Polymorphobacter sp.]
MLLFSLVLFALLLFWINPRVPFLGVPAWLVLLLCVALVAVIRRRLPPHNVSH